MDPYTHPGRAKAEKKPISYNGYAFDYNTVTPDNGVAVLDASNGRNIHGYGVNQELAAQLPGQTRAAVNLDLGTFGDTVGFTAQKQFGYNGPTVSAGVTNPVFIPKDGQGLGSIDLVPEPTYSAGVAGSRGGISAEYTPSTKQVSGNVTAVIGKYLSAGVDGQYNAQTHDYNVQGTVGYNF